MVEIWFREEGRRCSVSSQDNDGDRLHKPSLGGRFGAGLHLQAPLRGQF